MAPQRRRTRRGRPPGPEDTIQVGVRLPVSLVARIDAYAQELSEERPGIHVSRTDAIRVLLLRALESDGGP